MDQSACDTQGPTENEINEGDTRRKSLSTDIENEPPETTDQPEATDQLLTSPLSEERQNGGNNIVIIEYTPSRNCELENETCKSTSKDAGLSNDTPVTGMSTRSVYTNLVFYSISYVFLFSALQSFANIQSTVNIKEGLGTTSLAVLYTTMVLTNLFVTLFTLSLLSYKWMTVVSMLTYTVFFATGFYSSWGTLIPASILIGFGASHWWPTQQAYVTRLAVIHSTNTSTSRERTFTLFFGIFMGIFQTCQIWGNLSSSLIFGTSETASLNTTETDTALSTCGPDFCPAKAAGNNTVVLPPMRAVYIFTAFCVVMSLIAVLLVAILVTNVTTQTSYVASKDPKHQSKQCCQTVTGVLRHILTSRDQQLLVPISILSGMTMAFVSADLTLGYVSCPYGVKNIGFVIIAYGTFSSIGAFLAGKLANFVGSLPVIFIGMAAEIVALMTMLLWLPGVEQLAIVFVLAALCGIVDGLFQPVLMTLYSEYFIDNNRQDESLSTFRLTNSLGWAVSFSYSSQLCMRTKIIILLSVTFVSGVCLVILHFWHKAEERREQLEIKHKSQD